MTYMLLVGGERCTPRTQGLGRVVVARRGLSPDFLLQKHNNHPPLKKKHTPLNTQQQEEEAAGGEKRGEERRGAREVGVPLGEVRGAGLGTAGGLRTPKIYSLGAHTYPRRLLRILPGVCAHRCAPLASPRHPQKRGPKLQEGA